MGQYYSAYLGGGLGIKNLMDWNKSLINLHLWQVVQPCPTSFWASWVHSNLLKGRNFWMVKIPNDYSWIWRKVLKLLTLVQQFIYYRIRKGATTSLWFDPWYNGAALAMSPSAPIVLLSRLGPRAKVQDILSADG